jgi:hypothetical protein
MYQFNFKKRGVMVDRHTTKDEIISFVQNSPEEVNSKIAVFIAGMQAQKSLTDCRLKMDKYPPTGGDGLSVVKAGLGKR